MTSFLGKAEEANSAVTQNNEKEAVIIFLKSTLQRGSGAFTPTRRDLVAVILPYYRNALFTHAKTYN
jgi:hypothetical protein